MCYRCWGLFQFYEMRKVAAAYSLYLFQFSWCQLGTSNVPPDELEAECSLPAAVQTELGALVRRVAGPGGGGGGAADLAGAGAQHLAVIEHHPQSEGDQSGAERRPAVDGRVGDVSGGGRVGGGQRHPPPAPPVTVGGRGGGTGRGRLGPSKLYVVIRTWWEVGGG